jgi:hypothetical protein
VQSGGFGSSSNSAASSGTPGTLRQHVDQGDVGGPTGGDGGQGTAQPDLSKIERTGQIGIVVADGTFTGSVERVTRIAVTNGGMVLSSSSQNDRSGTFTLRIPAARFDRAMSQLRGMAPAGGVVYQDAAGKDVTAQFVDYHARLAILKKELALLTSLQSRATSANDILGYANRINGVQLQIETIQGDLNVLNDAVARATIDVELREAGAAPASEAHRPSLRSAWGFAVQGFLRILAAVVVGLGYLIPLAAIAALVWGAVTLVRRRRRVTS